MSEDLTQVFVFARKISDFRRNFHTENETLQGNRINDWG